MSELKVDVSKIIGGMIEAKVASGEYANASDYVKNLVLRDQPLSAEDVKWREEFLASIDRGIADANAGRVTDAEVVLARLEAKYVAMEERNRG